MLPGACAGLCSHSPAADTLWTRACSPRRLFLPHQRKPLSSSASSRAMRFTLNVLQDAIHFLLLCLEWVVPVQRASVVLRSVPCTMGC